MRRSVENAEHVGGWITIKPRLLVANYLLGLFSPRAGQHIRDEQRRRRSQYDRGTRLAEMDEYDYDTQEQRVTGNHFCKNILRAFSLAVF
jgi:hypothetical protein